MNETEVYLKRQIDDLRRELDRLKTNIPEIGGIWQDWTPTLTGWSTEPTGEYRYCVIGKICLLRIKQSTDGISDSTTTRLTLPITCAKESMAACQIRNNGANVSTPGLAKVYDGLDYINFFTGWQGTTFTSSGGKGILTCFLIYEIQLI